MGGSGRMAVAMLCIAAVMAGCGGDVDEREPRTTVPLSPQSTGSTSTTTSTSTVPDFGYDHDLVQQVWRDYEAAIDAIEAAVQDPVRDHPALADNLTGDQLAFWNHQLAQYAAGGLRVSYPVPSDRREWLKRVEMRSPTGAELLVCSIDDSVLEGPDGVVDGTRHVLLATEWMELEGGRWKLSARSGGDDSEGHCGD